VKCKHIILWDHRNCCQVRFFVIFLVFHLCLKNKLQSRIKLALTNINISNYKLLEPFSKHSYSKLNKLLKGIKDITIFVHVLLIVQVIIHLWKSNLEFFSSSKIMKTKNLYEYKVLKLNEKTFIIKHKVPQYVDIKKKVIIG
jgi:hypothetical protein